MEFVTLTAKADTSDVGVECTQCSAKRLALHLAEFFPSTVGRSLEFVAVKNIGKKLGNDDGPRGEFDFIFHLVTQRRYFTHYLLTRLGLNTSYVLLQRWFWV